MKRLLYLLIFSITFLNINAQTRHKIVNKPTTIPYLQTQSGITAISQNIEVSIEYYGVGVGTDDSIHFSIANLTNPALNVIIANPLQTIPKGKFTIDPQQINFMLAIQSSAVHELPEPASFDIQIAGGSDAAHSLQHVIVNNVPLNQPVTVGQIYITHVNLKGDTTYMPPFIRNNEAKEGRQCKVKYRVSGKLAHDSTITLKLEVPSGSSIKPELVTKTFTIKASHTSDTATIDSVYINFDISAQKDFGENEYIYLSFENDNNVRDIMCFTRRELINPNKPFWIEVGANLDLVDGLDANNLFTGVFFYKRDLKKFYSKKKLKNNTIESKNNNISIFAGIYESKTVSDSSSGSINGAYKYFDRNAINLVRNDSFPVFTDTGRLKFKTTTKNISLFISPSIRLTNGYANSDGLHVFASFWFEMLWSRKSVIADGSQLNRRDTAFIPANKLRGTPGTPATSNRYFDYRTQYIGVGLPIFMKDNDVNLFINPIIGFSNQRDIAALQTVSNTLDQELFILPKHRWNPFYITQFRLSEEKYGFAFTGEVRGFLLQNSRPQISLALTKKFDLNKFLEFK